MISKKELPNKLGKKSCIEGREMEVKKTEFLKGEIEAPSSKSITQRAIAISSVDGGKNNKSEILNYLKSDDIENAINAWGDLGAEIKLSGENKLSIEGFDGKPNPKKRSINVGESGTVLRLILPAAALVNGEIEIKGEDTLKNRANKRIVEVLRKLGVEKIEGKGRNHEVPIRIKNNGTMNEGKVNVRGDESSQVFSALLITMPLTENDVVIKTENEDELVSRPYIDMTIKMLERAGIKIEREGYKLFKIPRGQTYNGLGKFNVTGDYSSAAFIIAAATLIESDVKIKNLKKDGLQGDEEIIGIINRMGGDIKQKQNSVEIKGPFDLKGIEIDGRDIPDLVPIISVLASFADGETRIKNAPHLRNKESNRIKSVYEEFDKLGIDVKKREDGLTIIGGSDYESGKTLSPHDDHRIAMALSLIGLRIGDLKIENPGCIEKSYPQYLKHLRDVLGARINLVQ